ncbi:trafficking protein particle complex II-specific subunit 120 homolog isoform X2 [Cryptomeria japonica]|uniref:trafficking protein particle complex II-specific subunit 120 homolog isoform X2 n=1 Tax=Cryptomeria japonica TaxID=3369 RepID=UPI0025ACD384|nr:trafficking protein particle complex II-specific subunit 120 homolog isoform X2 [Cryptomeria japonica]
MEPDVSVEGGCMIRIVVRPVGHMPGSHMRDYVSIVVRHTKIDLSSISSFYTEHQKSPFAHQPWDTGSLRFKYLVGGAQQSPWEDFQASRKVLGVIGLCHCPSSPDLGIVSEQFAAICKAYPAALITRCFAFYPSDSQLEEDDKKRQNLIMFPPADWQALEFHMQTLIQDIAAALLMEFEKWVLHAESTGTILKTPLDSQASLSSEEVIKAKKRRLGRAQKTIGDFCLLAGSPVDANAHYSTAIELARLTGDVFWHAGAIEGSVCALVIDRMGQKDQMLEEEVKYRYYEVIQLYRRVSTINFELEATLKLARFLCRRELAKEVVELLMGAADGAKALIDASDRLVLNVEIARLFGALGYERKAAFFSRQVAQLYLQQDNCWAAISALQVLSMTSKSYRIQSKAKHKKPCCLSNEVQSASDGGRSQAQSIASLFESQWSTLQMVVLREILVSAVRAADPLAAWSAAARLLRSHYPLITPTGQSGLANALTSSAERLPSGTRCADPALPFIRLHSIPMLPPQMETVKRNTGKKDWWSGSAPSGPFIYTPFGESNDDKKQEIIWIVGEPVQVLVELANPCTFELAVESIYLSLPSESFEAFPSSVTLPPNTSQIISLSGIPISVGPLTVEGCIVRCFGVITEHLFGDVDDLLLGAAHGLILADPFRSSGFPKIRNAPNQNITVVPSLPLLIPHVIGGDVSTVLYEGEIRDIQIGLANAGSVAVVEANVSLSGKQQENVISIGHDVLQSALPLQPGASVVITVRLQAGQLNLETENVSTKIVSGNAGRSSKDGSGPTLVIHYSATAVKETYLSICLYRESNFEWQVGGVGVGLQFRGTLMQVGDDLPTDPVAFPPGRRLALPLQIRVIQGLCLVQARLLSMEIPAQINRSLPIPSTVGDTDLHSCMTTENTADSLVKIDPYRGSWGLRLLELELRNPTEVIFEIMVQIQRNNRENGNIETENEGQAAECIYPATRIDRDYAARVLIPLEHFKLPVLDKSFFGMEAQGKEGFTGKISSNAEKQTKAELNATIKDLTSRIQVKWQSGRNSFGEMNIKDAVQEALQTSVMDILLPDPLTFGFRVAKNHSSDDYIDALPESNLKSPLTEGDNSSVFHKGQTKGSIIAHELTSLEVLVRNNTREPIRMILSITCRDVAGENCFDGNKATVLWAGILSGIDVEVPPLGEAIHPFAVCFLVPGEYTILGAAVIHEANEILRARAKTNSAEEPIFCSGPPFRVHVVGVL